jgi:hypothetical protein
MKRRHSGTCVEWSVTPHPARTGWEVVRLNYDAANPQHLAQVEAAIAALTRVRCSIGAVQTASEPVRVAL